jgi:hypothetical protein
MDSGVKELKIREIEGKIEAMFIRLYTDPTVSTALAIVIGSQIAMLQAQILVIQAQKDIISTSI